MKVRLFAAGGGDCLLVTANDSDASILVDGGITGAYREHVAPFLSEHVERLSLVCVSHADADHVRGVIELFENELAWRVHDYQMQEGNPSHIAPDQPRPPPVDALWHNGAGIFTERIGHAAETALLALAAIESGSSIGNEDFALSSLACTNMATSIREGRTLRRLTSADGLDVPLNAPFGGKPVRLAHDSVDHEIGSMRLRLVGPHKSDLDRLTRSWETWLDSLLAEESIASVSRHVAERRAMTLEVSAPTLNRSLEQAASDLERASSLLDTSLGELGTRIADRSRVTIPNLASITFSLQERNASLLCTGDAHQRDIEKGLKVSGAFDADGRAHFTAIKVPHHGSEHNTDASFWKRVTAEHYLVCANGSHHNPDERVLDDLVDARLSEEAGSSQQSDRPFALWFDTPPDSREAREHLGTMIEHVKRRAADPDSKGRLSVEVSESGQIGLDLSEEMDAARG